MKSRGWKDELWLDEARSLLKNIGDIDTEHPIALILRHSHRLHSDNQERLLHMQITLLGKRMAIEFGKRLPKTRELGLFYSEHPRCEETALRIKEGYEQRGVQAIDHGCVRDLLGPSVKTSIGAELIEFGIDGFINRWANGMFPIEQIEPIEEYSIRIWNHITETARKSKENSYLNFEADLVNSGEISKFICELCYRNCRGHT